jgi:hypothetical protein
MYLISFQRGPDTTDWLWRHRHSGCGVCIFFVYSQTKSPQLEPPRLRRIKNNTDDAHKTWLQDVFVVRVCECGSNDSVFFVWPAFSFS